MSNNRLNVLINDETSDILNNLVRRGDKARFVEAAIAIAMDKSDIKYFFTWKSKDLKKESQVKNKSINIDNDFKEFK